MVFNSLTFVVFFAIVLLVHHSSLSWTLKKVNLLVASLLFYAAWNPAFVLLLVLSTGVDWLVTRRLGVVEESRGRWLLLLVSLVCNLSLLGFFKYGEFLLANVQALAAALGIHYVPPQSDIVLPVGISFYTFQALSYTIDVYRRTIRPWPSLLDYALYVSFFPQLVAGPIMRADHFLPQCSTARRATGEQLGWGFALLITGLFQKVVLADALLGPVTDRVYGAPADFGFGDAWLGTLAFSAQIFFDFAGYSACAIGVALCLGFHVADNFRSPYAAVGFSDFWRRWHISLSTWLRDYLYVSLGGSRKSVSRTYANLMITMLLGGLWHGASWRFVMWGGLHGAYLVLERALRARVAPRAWLRSRFMQPVFALATYACVCVTWVFFRARDFDDATTLLSAMFVPVMAGEALLGRYDRAVVLLLTVSLLSVHWILRASSVSEAWTRLPWWGRSALLASQMVALALVQGENRAFIYFQF